MRVKRDLEVVINERIYNILVSDMIKIKEIDIVLYDVKWLKVYL